MFDIHVWKRCSRLAYHHRADQEHKPWWEASYMSNFPSWYNCTGRLIKWWERTQRHWGMMTANMIQVSSKGPTTVFSTASFTLNQKSRPINYHCLLQLTTSVGELGVINHAYEKSKQQRRLERHDHQCLSQTHILHTFSFVPIMDAA